MLNKQKELAAYYASVLDGDDFTEPSYRLWDIQKRILDWNIKRGNTEYDAAEQLRILESEIKEGEDAFEELVGHKGDGLQIDAMSALKVEIIDSVCDRYVVIIGTLALSGYNNQELSPELLEHYNRIMDDITCIKTYGIEFDFNKAMYETLKEIDCRVQDPAQKALWESGFEVIDGEVREYTKKKWEKWKDQPKEELYKADYIKCLI